MSYDWSLHNNGQEQLTFDSMLLDFSDHANNTHNPLNLQGPKNSLDSRYDQNSLLEADFSSWPWSEKDTSEILGSQNLFDSRQDQTRPLDTDLSPWPWPKTVTSPQQSPRSDCARKIDGQYHECHNQNTEQVVRRAVTEIRQGVKELEDRMETRIAKVEERFNDSQNSLDQQAARILDQQASRVKAEVEVYISKLEVWASEMKKIVASVTESGG